jgi:hypothetical protein
MDERTWSDETGEFGDEGNPEGAKAPRSPAAGEFGGDGNDPGLRPQDAEPAEGRKDEAVGEAGRR